MNAFRYRLPLAVALFVAATGAIAADPAPQVIAVRDRWAEVNYDTPKKQREAAFEALAKQAAAARAAQPKDPAALIWEGIVLSSYAGERGGLGAMGLAKQAKADFEQAIKLDPNALDGSAYTSLGVLYYQVPGWPIGFGDDDKARELLRKGLQVSPNGIDANYFYGDFLQDQGDWKGAAAALEKALAAPARPGRELADQGRRKEVTALLAKVRTHL
ncbi:MAG: tetratricopeptide repeat protein [Pseudomonadota bacterium]